MIILPIVLGLLGFVQPCVVGMNSIFLGYLREEDSSARARELLKYTVVKTLFAALVGLGAAGVGAAVLGGASKNILRILLVLLGGIYIASRFKAMPVPNIMPKGNFSYGVLYGLGVPACAVPLLISLGLIAAFSGSIYSGVTLLSAFGLAISLPLLLIGISGRRSETMKQAARLTGVSPIFAGVTLILAGLLRVA